MGRPRIHPVKEKKRPQGRPLRFGGHEKMVSFTMWIPEGAKEGVRLLVHEFLDIYKLKNYGDK